MGQTTRHLHSRISEHLGIPPIMGKLTSNYAKSSVLSHSCASGHKVDFDNFKILSSCSDSYELMIHESRAVARTLMGGGGGGGGGCLFIYSCSARLVSFQIDKFECDFKRS